MEQEQIGVRQISALKRWGRNYRKGDVNAIAKSIVRFGFNGALRVWNGTVMAGNHQLLALLSLKDSGIDPPRGVWEQAGEWFVPCIDISHLSEEEAEAFGVADNRLQERGQTDAMGLSVLLGDLREHIEIEDMGFCQGDLDRMLAELAEDPEVEPANESEQGELDRSCSKRCEECGKRLAD